MTRHRKLSTINRGMVVESQSGLGVWVVSSDRARSRQCQDRLQTALGSILQRDLPPVHAGDVARDREPEARTAGRAAARGLQALKRFEDALEIVLRNARTRIEHSQDQPLGVVVDMDGRLAAVGHRVVDEVRQAAPKLRLDADVRPDRPAFDAHAAPGGQLIGL